MNTSKYIFVIVLCGLLFILSSCSFRNTTNFYVSINGNDNNTGSKENPVQSLNKAKELVRLQLSENPGKSVIVNIKEGFYNIDAPLVFTSEYSGNENTQVVFKAVEGEKPVLTGGHDLKNWQLLSDTEKLALLPSLVRGKIYVADLKAAGIHDYGDPIEIGNRPELFCNGQLQTLARWPNSGFAYAGQARGKTELKSMHGRGPRTKEGIFEYLDKRHGCWATEPDVCLGGYWYWDWAESFQKVEKIDVDKRSIYLEEPFEGYGYRDSLRYFGLNLFCEIDQPGEWYLNRDEGLLYWYPPKGVTPGKSQVVLSVFNKPFMVELKNCSNIQLRGLTFREGRGSAILISKGKNCLIADCHIEHFGEDGVHIDGGSGHGISGCLLNTFGCRGTYIKGGDRKTLTPANHFIENSVVKDFSLFKRTYKPAVYAEGCGIRINNNRFENSSSSAMRLEGNDIIVEYNEIKNVVNESDDQGGLDMWYNPSYRGIVVRYNRWTDIEGGTVNGGAGVRLDDMISGVQIYGNIFERCGSVIFGGVQIHGGKDNVVENNIFYDCPAAVSFSSWGEKRWLEHLDSPQIKEKILEEVDINSELYQAKYPELKNIRKNIDLNTIKNNLLVGCKQDFLREKGRNALENNSMVEPKGKSVEDFCKTEVLKKFGLEAIPLDKIGPLKGTRKSFIKKTAPGAATISSHHADYIVEPYFLDDGAWQTAMQLESGEIVAILMERNEDEEYKQYLIQSLDGGKTWKRIRPVNVDNQFKGIYGFTDLLVLQDGRWAAVASRLIPEQHNGALSLISFSSDMGKTWTPATLVGTAEQEGVYYKMNDRTIQTRSGRIVVPNAHAIDPDAPEGSASEAMVWFSDDNGNTWDKSSPCRLVQDSLRGMQEPCVVELNDGRLMILARTGSGRHYRSYSTDGGQTWGEPQPTNLIAACSPLTVKKMPDDRLFVVYNHVCPEKPGDLFPRLPIHYAVSEDNGETWSEPIVIDDDREGARYISKDKTTYYQYVYPSICFTRKGILISYGSTDRTRKCCVIKYPI